MSLLYDIIRFIAWMRDNIDIMLSTTHQALEKFDNQHDFERMSADILNALGYKTVVPIAPRGGGDGSRDITFLNYDGEPSLACVSLRKDANTKIMSDLSAHKKGDYAEYTFFTNQYLTSAEKKKITKFCLEELDAQFVPRDIELLRSLLDTNLKTTREDYLHIKDAKAPDYSVVVLDITKFSIKNVMAVAENDLNSYVNEQERDKVGSFGLPRLATVDMLTASAETMINAQRKYQRKLMALSDVIDNVLGFNCKITSDSADEHVEVHVSSESSARLLFDVQLLPKAPSRTGFDFGDIKPVNVFHDKSEFRASYIEKDGIIKSNLDKINSNHPKLLFDEEVYVVIPEGHDSIEVEVKIFSKNLANPQVKKVTLAKSDAVLKEL